MGTVPARVIPSAEVAAEYQKVRDLAAGGMGRVELVVRREGGFARACARKRLHAHLAGDPELRAMFLDEARIAGLIRHANVVAVIDFGQDGDGPFLVMELVEGVPLVDVVRRAGATGEMVPVQVACEIARGVAEGLAAAHSLTDPEGRTLGVVHRDVTPSNVLVGLDGVPRVTDFGVARALDRAAQTRLGVLKGKLSYMAPEQLALRPVDGRTDLWSLGVVIVETLTGRALYGGADSAEVARRIAEDPAPDLGWDRADAAPELVALVFELLSKDPSGRPPSARAVADRLAAIVATLRADEGVIDTGGWLRERFGEPVRAMQAEVAAALGATTEMALPPEMEEPARPMEQAARARGGRMWPAAVAAVAALALVGAVVAVMALGGPEDAPMVQPAAGTSDPSPRVDVGPVERPVHAPASREEKTPPAADGDGPPPTETPPTRGKRRGGDRTGAMPAGGMMPVWSWE